MYHKPGNLYALSFPNHYALPPLDKLHTKEKPSPGFFHTISRLGLVSRQKLSITRHAGLHLHKTSPSANLQWVAE